MKKILVLFAILYCTIVTAQDFSKKITISFVDSPLEKVLNDLESKTGYSFFYIDGWLKDIKVTGSYTDSSLEKILTEVLKETPINFYLHEGKKIILTKNNVVFNKLPEGFLTSKTKKEVNLEEEVAPVFFEENSQNQLKVIKIGKANLNSNDKYFYITGTIKNSITNELVQGAVVSVKGKQVVTETNEKGYYKLRVPKGFNTIEVELVGNEKISKNVVIYNNDRLNFAMNETFESLEEVDIYAKKDINEIKAITGVSQIEVAKIKNIPLVLGEQDIFRVATTLPGITTAGEGASGYNVRGGKTDQNLILLDGMTIYNPAHFFGLFSSINPFVLKSVDIYKGNIPAEFGGRLSSVFDIKSKDVHVNKIQGEASIGAIMSNLALQVPVLKDKSTLMVGARSTYSNWILRSLDSKNLKDSEASFYDVSLKYLHKINDKNSLSVSGYLSKDRFNVTLDSIHSFTNKAISISSNHKFNEKNNLNVLLTNSNYGFNIDYYKQTTGGFDLGYNINETELKLNFSYLRSKQHHFNYGVSSKLYNVNPGNIKPIGQNSSYAKIDIPKEKALESAFFISDDFKLNDRLQFYLGLRYSNFLFLGPGSQRIYTEGAPKDITTLLEEVQYKNNEVISNYGGLEYRLSAKYSFPNDLTLKASYNSTNQYIHTLSNNTTNSPTDTWKLSDLNIKPQTSKQFSFGVYKNLKEDEYKISLEGYYKILQNTLDFKTGAKLLLNEELETNVVQGEGKAYGVEFLIKKTRGRLNGWLGYTYSRSFNKFDSNFATENINRGEYFPSNYDKPNDFSLVANYKLTKRYSVSLNGVYQTGRPITFPIGQFVFNNIEFVTYSDRNKFRIPDYYRLDLSVNIEGNHKRKKLVHSFWSFSIYNVLGRNNPYSVFFVSEDSEIKAYKSSIFSVPIPTITFNIKF